MSEKKEKVPEQEKEAVGVMEELLLLAWKDPERFLGGGAQEIAEREGGVTVDIVEEEDRFKIIIRRKGGGVKVETSILRTSEQEAVK